MVRKAGTRKAAERFAQDINDKIARREFRLLSKAEAKNNGE